ncbi:MAG TPA: FAD-binding oxidoreductase, partial [Chondromyces sp.]|nr:FAD-binding oxidoreductase [Chondromyces sp.]
MSQDKINARMPQFPEPLWRDSVDFPSFPKLNENVSADVAIIGAGITGLTAAYRLVKQGKKVVIIEASNVLNGTTGHTTAKVTAQHGLIYDEFIQHFGEEKAKLYYEAGRDAINWLRTTAKEENIDCDWSDEDAYVYTNDSSYVEKINKEAKAYETLGIEGGLAETMPLKVPFKAAVRMTNQAQYHPLKFYRKILSIITEKGGKVFEHTTAVKVKKAGSLEVTTRDGYTVTCEHVIEGSHFPFYDRDYYFTRLYPMRSYLIAIKPKKEFPGGMYITAEEPTRSVRSALYRGEEVLLVGGENHKTGHGISTHEHYEALEQYAEEEFGIKEFPYRWSAQDLVTLDKLPYIGRTSDDENIYVATGYRKWGMTNGTAAGLLISELIMNRQ